jgi:hypothetical protein
MSQLMRRKLLTVRESGVTQDEARRLHVQTGGNPLVCGCHDLRSAWDRTLGRGDGVLFANDRRPRSVAAGRQHPSFLIQVQISPLGDHYGYYRCVTLRGVNHSIRTL